jgi:hypothetical protein
MKWHRPNKGLSEQRAPRVNLQGIVSAVIHLENGRQLTAKLRTLSVTGGLLDVAVCLDERIEISLMFRFGPGILQSKAQLLFPMRGGMGYLQPFRFTTIGMKERQTIQSEVAALLTQNTVPGSPTQGIPGFRPTRFNFESF